MRAVLVAAVAAIAIAGVPRAQPATGADALRRVIHAVEVDTKALADGADAEPLDTLHQLANDINRYAQSCRRSRRQQPVGTAAQGVAHRRRPASWSRT